MMHLRTRLSPVTGLRWFAALLFVSTCTGVSATERTRVTVLASTDLHAHVYPVDYFTDRPAQEGLAVLQTLVWQERKVDPELVLIDCGDTIQGTPLGYHHVRYGAGRTNPIMRAMNQMGYAAMAVGNHEYNFGREVMTQTRAEASFPWLCANTVRKSDGQPYFTPYLVMEIKGVRVAILGLSTPGIPYWEAPERIADLEYRNPIETAARYVPFLRGKERADVVVIAAHMGLEEDLAAHPPATPNPIPFESTCIEIARTVPGVDVLFMGHTHREIPALVIGQTLLTQAGRWGNRLAKAELYVERDDDRSPWRVIARGATTLAPSERTAPDPEILALAKADHEATQAWLDHRLGSCAGTLTGATAREEDNALLDLVHRVQLEAGRADISFAASFNPRARLEQGGVTVRGIYSLYTYENTLAVVEVTGRQVKAALEHSAEYYVPYEPGKTVAQLADPRAPGYNFDTAEGVEYEIDLRRPVGDRIRNLKRNGAPFDLDATYRVALNSYRRNGGGGYTMFREAKAATSEPREIRELIIEWVEKHGEVPATPTNNWRFTPLGTD